MGIATDTTVTVLDHVERITVPGNPFHEAANEYWALICLHHGMEFLYDQALRSDEAVKRPVNPSGNARFFASGNDPAFDQVPKALLTCAFHWYAISACQYIRTVGAIAHRQDSGRPLPKVYAQGVIPAVVAFRDKVAAHFAWSTKNNRDNDAERLASILPPLVFVNDSFHVGAFTVAVSHGGIASNSKAIQPWSICRVHEQLRVRYWPDDRQPASQPGGVKERAEPDTDVSG
jgi:hypothetical protein